MFKMLKYLEQTQSQNQSKGLNIFYLEISKNISPILYDDHYTKIWSNLHKQEQKISGSHSFLSFKTLIHY